MSVKKESIDEWDILNFSNFPKDDLRCARHTFLSTLNNSRYQNNRKSFIKSFIEDPSLTNDRRLQEYWNLKKHNHRPPVVEHLLTKQEVSFNDLMLEQSLIINNKSELLLNVSVDSPVYEEDFGVKNIVKTFFEVRMNDFITVDDVLDASIFLLETSGNF